MVKKNILLLYSMAHVMTVQQVKDFLKYAKIMYDRYDIIDIMKDGRKVSIDVIVYLNDVEVGMIKSMHSVDMELQNKISNIPSHEGVNYIYGLTMQITNIVLEYNPEYFYIAGQPTLCMHVYNSINNQDISTKCIEATTERTSEDNPDGTKTSVFKHDRWRNVFIDESIMEQLDVV